MISHVSTIKAHWWRLSASAEAQEKTLVMIIYLASFTSHQSKPAYSDNARCQGRSTSPYLQIRAASSALAARRRHRGELGDAEPNSAFHCASFVSQRVLRVCARWKERMRTPSPNCSRTFTREPDQIKPSLVSNGSPAEGFTRRSWSWLSLSSSPR